MLKMKREKEKKEKREKNKTTTGFDFEKDSEKGGVTYNRKNESISRIDDNFDENFSFSGMTNKSDLKRDSDCSDFEEAFQANFRKSERSHSKDSDTSRKNGVKKMSFIPDRDHDYHDHETSYQKRMREEKEEADKHKIKVTKVFNAVKYAKQAFNLKHEKDNLSGKTKPREFNTFEENSYTMKEKERVTKQLRRLKIQMQKKIEEKQKNEQQILENQVLEGIDEMSPNKDGPKNNQNDSKKPKKKYSAILPGEQPAHESEPIVEKKNEKNNFLLGKITDFIKSKEIKILPRRSLKEIMSKEEYEEFQKNLATRRLPKMDHSSDDDFSDFESDERIKKAKIKLKQTREEAENEKVPVKNRLPPTLPKMEYSSDESLGLYNPDKRKKINTSIINNDSNLDKKKNNKMVSFENIADSNSQRIKVIDELDISKIKDNELDNTMKLSQDVILNRMDVTTPLDEERRSIFDADNDDKHTMGRSDADNMSKNNEPVQGIIKNDSDESFRDEEDMDETIKTLHNKSRRDKKSENSQKNTQSQKGLIDIKEGKMDMVPVDTVSDARNHGNRNTFIKDTQPPQPVPVEANLKGNPSKLGNFFSKEPKTKDVDNSISRGNEDSIHRLIDGDDILSSSCALNKNNNRLPINRLNKVGGKSNHLAVSIKENITYKNQGTIKASERSNDGFENLFDDDIVKRNIGSMNRPASSYKTSMMKQNNKFAAGSNLNRKHSFNNPEQDTQGKVFVKDVFKAEGANKEKRGLRYKYYGVPDLDSIKDNNEMRKK